MRTVTCGNCGICGKLLVVLKWKQGKRTLVVVCEECREEMHYNLDEMIETLGLDLSGMDDIVLCQEPRLRQ